jgi:RimJ/RimL family protein N-acetyltransferase
MLLGYFVENQKIIYNGFVKKNAVYPLGDFNKKDFSELSNDINDFINNKKKIRINFLSEPKRNILKLFRFLNITIRLVKENDIRFVYNLSNEPLVRENSYNSDKITFENHEKWFNNQLIKNKEVFYILEYDNKPYGQVRFTVKESFSIIGIAISSKNRGMGLATQSLILSTEKYFQKYNLPIYAYIKKTNMVSVNSFKKAGFVFLKNETVEGVDSFVYVKNKD